MRILDAENDGQLVDKHKKKLKKQKHNSSLNPIGTVHTGSAEHQTPVY